MSFGTGSTRETLEADFEEKDTPKKENCTALGPVRTMEVEVGKRYRIINDQRVMMAKVEKIYVGTMGKTYVTLTMHKPGTWFGEYTTHVEAEDFKMRVLGNGISKMEI